MAEEPVPVTQLLRSHKARLIQILSGGADFVLQHADSRFLLSTQGYEEVNACSVPSVKVKKLLDHIIQRGPEAAQGLLQLLKERALQEAFPMLHFVNDLPDSTVSAETSRKRDKAPFSKGTTSAKKTCNSGAGLVKEKKPMTVARAIRKTCSCLLNCVTGIPAEQEKPPLQSQGTTEAATVKCPLKLRAQRLPSYIKKKVLKTLRLHGTSPQ